MHHALAHCMFYKPTLALMYENLKPLCKIQQDIINDHANDRDFLQILLRPFLPPLSLLADLWRWPQPTCYTSRY